MKLIVLKNDAHHYRELKFLLFHHGLNILMQNVMFFFSIFDFKAALWPENAGFEAKFYWENSYIYISSIVIHILEFRF